MAFATLAPFGARRGDWQAALVAATVANTARDPKHRREPFGPADFLLEWGTREQAEGQSWEEQLRIVAQLNVAFGGRDLRDDK